eukprot:3331228-Rhodomonas_salina.2
MLLLLSSRVCEQQRVFSDSEHAVISHRYLSLRARTARACTAVCLDNALRARGRESKEGERASAREQERASVQRRAARV